MNFKKMMACWALLGSAAVMAQTANRVIEAGATRIEVLGQNFAGLPPISPKQSRLVIYSLDDLSLPGATSIFVNGTYHASLIKGAYSELCYKTGDVELGARQMEVGRRPKDLPDTITVVGLKGAATQFLRVREQGGRPLLEPVPAAQAERELPAKRLQLHTISRVAQECVIAPPAPVVPAVITNHSLSADTLFAFARSDRAAMTSLGTAAIDNLVGRLRNDYSRIESLNIIGHADPLGNPAINERLAIERANTVRQYIESTSQLRTPISAEGRGAREPVATNCPRVDSPLARECNQPNRRVVIQVTGELR